MAQQIAGQPTVALGALTTLDINQFIGQYYDRFEAFERALKVFQKCFLHYRSFNIYFYEQMWFDFFDEMLDLYNVRNDPRLPAFNTAAIDLEVNNELRDMSVGVTQFETTDPLVRARIQIELGYAQHSLIIWQPNLAQKDQNRCRLKVSITHTAFNTATQNDRQLFVNYSDAVVLNNWRGYPTFLVPYRQLHHEGFRQWLQFGNTRLLFCIEFSSQEINYIETRVASFHINTILFAVKRRLTHLRGQPPNQQFYRHNTPLFERRVTHEIGIVDPSDWEAYWGTAHDRTQNHTNYGRVKYIDIQIGNRFGEELTSPKYCTCNEFCNMNAFFHYNPVYRFLLVEHNRHYVRNRTTVANWYQLALAKLIIPDPNVQLTPVYSLFNSISERVTQNHLIFYTRPFLKGLWRRANPLGMNLEGVVYMTMTRINLAEAMAVNYGEHFDQNAFLNIENFMERMYELHSRIAYYYRFVQNNKDIRKQWVNEFENRSLIPYFAYMTRSVNSTLTDVNQRYKQILFTPDHELRVYPTLAVQRTQLTRWRLIEHMSYQYNKTFIVGPFTFFLNRLWIAFTRFGPKSLVSKSRPLRDQYDTLEDIAHTINQILTNPQNTLHRVNLSRTSAQELQSIGITQNGIQWFRHFYKLKLYSRLFKIQCKFLDSLFKHSNTNNQPNLQGFNVFPFIWNCDWVEDIFAPTPVPNLFVLNKTFVTSIEEFYVTFWGHPPYWQPIPPNPTWDVVRAAVFDEYAKRRFWERNSGDNREKFEKIIADIEGSLENLIIQCRTNFFSIIDSMEEIRTYLANQETNLTEENKKYCYILDVLVYWLTRAVLYLLTVIVVSILKSIDDLHINNLVNRNIQYFLSKPGLIKLFKTKTRVLRRVDEILTIFVAFSNPFDNIVEVVRQTKYDIKMLYKQFFRKLLTKWMTEFNQFFTQPSHAFFPMVKLHLVAGTAFMISYIDDYRKLVMQVRRNLDRKRLDPQMTNILTHIPFCDVWDLCFDWFDHIDQNETTRPFDLNRWQTELGVEFVDMDLQNFNHLLADAGVIVLPTP